MMKAGPAGLRSRREGVEKRGVVTVKDNDGAVIAPLSGRIDSSNAPAAEKELLARLEGCEGRSVTLDASALQYISSAGLRVILRLRKSCPALRIVGVSQEVYEILEMTGFTEMMPVEKAFRSISTAGCEEIGRGSNGIIYRIDRDTVVKVYKNADALDEIRHEREVARLALILGIPTAIPYDVVRAGESYGSVFELLDARSFSEIIASEPEKLDWCAREYAALLKKIHGTRVPEGRLPDMKQTVLGWARFVRDYLPEEAGSRLVSLVEDVPHDDRMIHGDYHTKNIVLQNGEVLLVDMDTLSVGHPIFELGSMFNAFIGFSEPDHEQVKRFQGFDFETSNAFWRRSLSAYLGTGCESKLREVEDKARIIGYMRLIRRTIRRGGLESESGRGKIGFWKERLLALLDRTDTLCFRTDEIILGASKENLPELLRFINERLDPVSCPPKARLQTELAAEEIFVNIASYAYAPGTGDAAVRVGLSDDPPGVTLSFTDRGVPYDPLSAEEPATDLTAEERGTGGLGVFLTKKLTDSQSYEYADGRNVLTVRKSW